MTVEEWKKKNPPIRRKPMTNADRLRQMSDEELAKHICCPYDQCIDLDMPCSKCVVSWLKAPVEVDNG